MFPVLIYVNLGSEVLLYPFFCLLFKAHLEVVCLCPRGAIQTHIPPHTTTRLTKTWCLWERSELCNNLKSILGLLYSVIKLKVFQLWSKCINNVLKIINYRNDWLTNLWNVPVRYPIQLHRGTHKEEDRKICLHRHQIPKHQKLYTFLHVILTDRSSNYKITHIPDMKIYLFFTLINFSYCSLKPNPK